MSQGRSTPCIGDGDIPPTFNDWNPYFMGPYKPRSYWVHELSLSPILWEIMGVFLEPIAHITLPETNIFAPKNGWLEYDPFLLGFGLFSGAMSC